MDDIASGLGMSKKTLYQYYADKEELVDAVFVTVIEGNKAQCLKDRSRAENAVHEIFLAFDMMQDMLVKMNPVVIFDLEKYHPAVHKKFHEHKYGFLYKMIKSNLEQGIEEELYRPEMDIDVMTRFRIESIMLPFNSDVFPNNRTQLLHIEQELLEHFLYGLATPKGQKLIQKYKSQRTQKQL